MFDKVKSFTQNFLKNKKKSNIIIVLGIIGILLIAFSDAFLPNQKGPSKKTQDSLSVNEYITELENKTKKLISSIDGAGKCKIMITAEQSQEKILFYDKSISTETAGNSSRRDEDLNLVVIEGDSGNDEAITQKIIEPKIRGVLILAKGGDDPKINEQITEAAKTLLGVTSNKIFVAKLN